MKPSDRVIIALDVARLDAAREILAKTAGLAGMYKVGSQLFSVAGPAAVEHVQEAGGSVFLDLKFHDIPNTVARAVEEAVGLGVKMLNVHASGGLEMMRAAAEAADRKARTQGRSRPVLLGVTVLTSIDDVILRDDLGCSRPLPEQVLHLAALAKRAGLDGVVASPRETAMIRERLGPHFVIVTPGVRPRGADVGDQKRVMTPGEAVRAGADYIVVGRPVTAAPEPVAALRRILDEIEAADREARNTSTGTGVRE